MSKQIMKMLREERLRLEKIYGKPISKIWGGRKKSNRQERRKTKEQLRKGEF